MENRYVGKICPYCHDRITGADTVAVCSVCGMPHHLACWQANVGCTTFGCTGVIREVIGAPPAPAAEPGAQRPDGALPAADAVPAPESPARPPRRASGLKRCGPWKSRACTRKRK